MTRVLVFGHAPLPWEDLNRFYAPGKRTWHLAKPLIDAGHEVTVVASRIPFVYPRDPQVEEASSRDGCPVYRVVQEEFEKGDFARDMARRVDPDCIVAVGYFASYVCAMNLSDWPLWADINGSTLAEAQARAYVYGNNELLRYHLDTYPKVIGTADRFSAVSGRQKYEIIGQLGMTGRLNKETFGYDFVCAIPNGVEPLDLPPAADPGGSGPGKDEFVVLWSGGFNTWTDVDTLYRGLELAMQDSPDIRFVSTGGSIQGHDEMTYPRLERMVAASPFRDRFHLKGWVRKRQALSYYGTASIGINIDASHYEVMLGARNRILEWAAAGLPAVSTNLCEFTEELASKGLLFPIRVGDPRSLADSVLGVAAEQDALGDVADRLKRYVLESHSYQTTTTGLREWVERPRFAPDREARIGNSVHESVDVGRGGAPRESSWSRLLYYLKSEGVLSTTRRLASWASRRLKGR